MMPSRPKVPIEKTTSYTRLYRKDKDTLVRMIIREREKNKDSH